MLVSQLMTDLSESGLGSVLSDMRIDSKILAHSGA